MNGVLSLFGALVSIYVYLKYPHPAAIQHSGKSAWVESIESYIFVFPAFQIALFLIPAFFWMRWQSFLRRAVAEEALQKSRNQSMQQLDSILVYQLVCILFSVSEIGMLSLTIYRSMVLATKSF